MDGRKGAAHGKGQRKPDPGRNRLKAETDPSLRRRNRLKAETAVSLAESGPDQEVTSRERAAGYGQPEGASSM
jgi:hypothetical protein